MLDQFGPKYDQFIQSNCQMLKKIRNKYVLGTENFIITGDLGHSMMRKEIVSF